MLDGPEASNTCLNILVGDSAGDADSDLITNINELSLTTNPCSNDTDEDGLNDYIEAVTVGCLQALTADSDGDGLCDGNTSVMDGATLLCSAGEDWDLDGVVDPGETYPCNADSDTDGLSDSYEIFYAPTSFNCGSDCGVKTGCTVQTYNGHDYLFCETAKIWSDSRDFCRSYGGDLVAVGSTLEMDFIKTSLDTLEFNTRHSWSGMNDLENEGSMVWSHGSPVTYENWLINEPNDSDGSENCVIFGAAQNRTWLDFPCSYLAFFVCEDGFALNPFSTDSDGDSVSDYDEINTYGTEHNIPDTDMDGLSDYLEAVSVVCLSASNPDTDSDGLCDGNTAVYDGSTLLCAAGEDMNTDGVVDTGETDFCDSDSDDDTLLDGEEVLTYNTNPNNNDTDSDGLNDSIEAVTVGCLFALTPDTDGDGLCDGNTSVMDGATLICSAGEDLDLDGVVDPEESDFCNTDTDADTLDDGTEVLTYGTDPTKTDTDDDTMPDQWEVTQICLDATVNDASSDSDSDTLTNLTEYGLDSNPCLNDTDGDSILDGQEAAKRVSKHTGRRFSRRL